MRLSGAEADATCEHQRNPVSEAVQAGSNSGLASFDIQFRIPYVMSEWTGSRREYFGGEKESKCQQKKTQLGDVRF